MNLLKLTDEGWYASLEKLLYTKKTIPTRMCVEAESP